MDNSNRIAELEERKKQIDVEIAFHKGAKIKAKVKLWHGWIDVSSPEFKWETCDYCIAEEPKRIPFDGSDAFNLLGRKFKIKKYESDFVIAIGVDEDGLYFHHDTVTYESLSYDYEIWNDLLKVFEPCTKIA